MKQQATGVYEIRRKVLWKLNRFGRARQSDETTQGTVLRQDVSSQAAATRAGFNRDGHTDKDMVLLGKNWTKTVKLFCLCGSHLVMRLEPTGSVRRTEDPSTKTLTTIGTLEMGKTIAPGPLQQSPRSHGSTDSRGPVKPKTLNPHPGMTPNLVLREALAPRPKP